MASPGGEAQAEASPAGGRWGQFYDALGHAGGAILAIMAAAVFIQVVLRALGRAGIDGLEEIPRYLFVWLVMLGAAAAMHRGEHTALLYFRDRLPPRPRDVAIILVNAAGIALFVVLIKLAFVLVPNAQLQTSAGLGLSLGYVYAAVPFGAVLMILPMLRNLVLAGRALWLKRS
jgi:TRAP-type C4-dicarboxylate transport system permease small subunit